MAVVGDVLFFLFLVLSLVIGGPVAVYWSYSQVRRKGYRPPAAIFIVLVGMAAGVAGAFALKPGNAWNAPTIFWHVIGVPMVLATAALGVLVLILPRRKARVFGERRTHFPFRVIGRLLQVLAVSVVVLAVIVWMSSGDASGSGPMALLGTMLWAAGRYLIREAKTLHVPPLQEVFKEDPRPPALYLRAFNQESQFFVIGPKAVYGKWAKSFLAAISQGNQIGITVEEYLAQDIDASIGPFVALGSPEDWLAPPGALRVYAKDDEWKTRFDELARRAACVIVEVSKSDNLHWEFEHLRAEGMQEKLFVLTRPTAKGARMAWANWGMLWKVKGIRSMTWPEFSSDLQKLGYQINFGDPGAGAVLAFDSQGEGFVLTAEGNWPQDFVEPIRAWVSERKKVGRCVDSKCVTCGREVYALATETETLCSNCRAGATSAKPAWIRLGGLLSALVVIAIPFALTVLIGLVVPDAWFDPWAGWILTVLLVLTVVVATYWIGRKKDRSES